MSGSDNAVTVLIMDKEYRVACPKDEAENLHSAARYLDEKMREIRQGGRVIGTDRIAVMAALNIAHELLDKDHPEPGADSAGNRVRSLRDKVESALNESNQLEF